MNAKDYMKHLPRFKTAYAWYKELEPGLYTITFEGGETVVWELLKGSFGWPTDAYRGRQMMPNSYRHGHSLIQVAPYEEPPV